MADLKISQLPVATSVQTTDVLPVVDAATTKQVPVSLLDSRYIGTVRKNATGSGIQRNQINFIEGNGVGIAVSDDSVNGEVDVTITANGAAGTTTPTTNGYRGVSLSGGEFSGSFQANSQADYTYFANQGMNVIRVPFSWYRLQPTINAAFNTTELGYIQQQVAWAKSAGMSVILDMHNYGRRFVYGNGGLTSDFTNSPQYSLSYPYGDQNAGAGTVTLRDYGRGTFGTLANPVNPATSYIFSLTFSIASITNSTDEVWFEVFRTDDNNEYYVAFNPTNSTWTLFQLIAGVRTTLASGTKTLALNTNYTIIVDVGQTTAGKLNVTFNGSPLYTSNSVSLGSLTHGYAAIYPTALHVVVSAITLNVNGDTTSGQPAEYRVTDAKLPMSAWNDFWTRFSTAFKSDPTVLGYDHNEPYSMPIPTSTTNYSQAVATANSVPLSTVTNMYQNMVNTIRANGDTKYVFVALDNFAGAQNFTTLYTANPNPWVTDTITPSKVAFTAHYYPDTDHSGTFATDTLPTNAAVLADLQPILTWSKTKGIPLLMGEYGIPARSVWYPTMDYILTLMDQYSAWGTYWAAGDIYTSVTTIQPTSSYTVDAGQLPTIKAHLASSSPVTVQNLTNVSINQPADNDLLAYDSASKNWTNQNAAAAAVASAVHTHAASDVVSGTVATARLGSGSASNTTFLRGDQTWATPAGGGGGITGPGTTVNTALALWSGTTGAALLNSGITVDGSNNLSTLTDSAFFFKTGASDVLIKYAGVGTDALLIQNVNAGSGKIKISYTNSIVFDLFGTGTAATLDSQGSLGIGISPSAKLTLKAGTATANTAPLKLTSGVNLTTPEDGAVEYNGTHFYATVGSTRYQLDQQSAGGSGITRTITSISTATTAGATAATDYVYLVSGTTTLTLPTAVGNTNRYTVKNTGSATVTVATTSSQTIDGSTTATLPVQYTSIDLISDGTNWNVL